MFYVKLEPLYSTQSFSLFVAYKESFNVPTGHRNPRSIIDGFNPGKLVLNNCNNKYVFPAINSYNNYATNTYDAQNNTKFDHTIECFSFDGST